jgi:hypothetical protein
MNLFAVLRRPGGNLSGNLILEALLMIRLTVRASALVLLSSLLLACSSPAQNSPASGQSNSQAGARGASARGGGPADLQFKAPEGWVSEPPSNNMRAAQYKLPGDGGADASLVVYFFGAGQGGTVQANLDRWIGQVQQPDGSQSKDKAKTEKITVNGMNVTLLDVTGSFTDSGMGGGSPQTIQDARMRAAVYETAKGNYFVKLTGPRSTVDRWGQAYMDFINSAQLK